MTAPPSEDGVQAADLFGRTTECGRLQTLIAAAQTGESGALLVLGDPGIGKSALLGQVERWSTGARVLRTAGVETESELPYSGLSELLTPLVGYLDTLPPVQAEALRGALALGPPVPGDPFTVCAAVLGLMAAAAERAPLIVLVDDAHWLDSPTQQALAFTARRIRAEGIVLVFAARDEPPGILHAAGLAALRLGPLGDADARAVVADRAGLAGHVADVVVAAAAGNPLGLVELPALLTDAQIAGREPLPDPLDPGKAVADAFLRRARDLSPAARSALLVIACEGAAEIALVRAACSRLGTDEAALEEAERAGAIVLDGSARFRHPLLRSSVYHAASAQQRRAVHGALAAVTPAAHDARRAWHRALATVGPDEEVAAELEQVAVGARLVSGHSAAARAWEHAARLTADPIARARRLLEAAGDWFFAAAPDRFGAVVGVLLAETTDPLIRARARALGARAAAVGGHPMAAHAALVEEARAIEDDHPDEAALMLAEAASLCVPYGEPRLGVETAARAQAVAARGSGSSALPADIAYAMTASITGEARRCVEIVDGWLPVIEQMDPLAGVHQILQGPTLVLLYAQRFEDARRLSERIAAAGRSRSSPMVLPLALSALAEIEYRTGHWTAARAAAHEADRLVVDVGLFMIAPYLRGLVARNAAALGQEDECRRAAAECLALGGESLSEAIVSYAHFALALLANGKGRHDEAIDLLEPVARMTDERDLGYPNVVMFEPDLIEAYIRAERPTEAAREIEAFARRAQACPGAWAQAALARCRGLAAQAGAFERHFDESLAAHARTPMPFERARTELCYGERLRRERRRVDARRPLRAALATFDRLGAADWSARARSELRACGETLGAPHGPGLAALTPQELQIALAVGGGASNRDAATALFLSAKTVDFHLRNIYRKLGIHSRSELAVLVAKNEGNTDGTHDGFTPASQNRGTVVPRAASMPEPSKRAPTGS